MQEMDESNEQGIGWRTNERDQLYSDPQCNASRRLGSASYQSRSVNIFGLDSQSLKATSSKSDRKS
jgi:hypothetical protein